jgi:hypothetical protein
MLTLDISLNNCEGLASPGFQYYNAVLKSNYLLKDESSFVFEYFLLILIVFRDLFALITVWWHG